MDFFSAIGSVLSGGLTGILGAGIQTFAQIKLQDLQNQAQKDKYAHDVEMLKANAEIQAQEWSARTQEAQVVADAQTTVSADAAFSAVATNEPKLYSEGHAATPAQAWFLFLLDFFRGIIRPALTTYLCVITTMIYFQAKLLIKADLMSATDALSLTSRIIDTILYLTTTCVLFWFGTRNKQNPPKIS